MNKNATIVQIAKESGVSIATVSRVINGTAPVAESTRERVMAAINKHNYVPNIFARNLIRRQSMVIGIVMPDITNPYFSEMFSEFERAARDNGYSVLLCNTSFRRSSAEETTRTELHYFRMMQEKSVDGVVIAGGQVDLQEVSKEYRTALQQLAQAVPVVVLGNKIEEVNCLFIQRERGQGVFSAISYLASLGHRRIAFVGGERGVGITEARLQAYRNTLHSLKLAEEAELVAMSDYYVPDGFRAAEMLLSSPSPFTALLAMNDNIALGVYRALADAGLRVPQDVSIVSCDRFYTADYLVPRLTSVDQHNELFCRFVIQVLLGAMHGVRENISLDINPELIIRESCAPPAPASRWA